VGDGSEKKHLQDYAQSLKLGDSVVFEPAVDFETLVSYYKTVNLFLLTSFYEGWPLAPIEALASGLPVVMTDVVSGHETIKDGVNAAIVPIGDSRALALRISQLIESPEKLAQLKKGAENSFPNPLSKEKYLELHTKLLKDIAKPKVCYILPLYEEGTDTHFFYNYLLIKEVAKRQDIFVVVEKCPTSNVGQIKQNLRISNCYIQKFKFPPLRFLEMLFICLRLRLSGYKNFYVHYSYYGALAVWLTTWLSDNQVRIFYWNRGMPWLFNRSRFKEKLFKFVLRHTILVTGPESLAKEYVVRYGVKEYRVVSNWVDVERFSPSTNRLNENSLKSERLEGLSKAQVLQDLAWRDGASRAIRQQANMRVLAKLGAEAKPGSRIVLFVHHLSKRKGADLIPEIAKGFGDDTLFLVVGDGPELEYLKERASFKFGDASEPPERGLSARNLEHARSNIVLLGKVPNSEIPKLFHAADVFFMPSREEGSPRVILEAMASGVPFVASDVGGTRELVPRNLAQFLCKPEDVKCFRDKIKTLLSDKALYDKARAECLAHAKNFDISRGVKEFIDLFKNT
ncbi:MAG: glycosyltransferase, partial [bacterium]|nr:glycosyltransferase [bacterium]